MDNLRVLITGCSGMLGREFVPLYSNTQLLLTDTNPNQNAAVLDITKSLEVEKLVNSFDPDVIINCAAYTQVDKAESDAENCFLVNSIGPMNLAKAAKRAMLVHISTDYVYAGDGTNRGIPYQETDSVAPCGVYGLSKYLGDQFVLDLLPNNSLIARTSWLHGRAGVSFVDTILKLAQTRESISIVNDQYGSPTWAPWLAQTIVHLISRKITGVYNISSDAGISWFDFAKEIVTQAGLKCNVTAQSSAELSRPARRPFYSVLDISKLERELGSKCQSWKSGIEEHLKHYAAR